MLRRLVNVARRQGRADAASEACRESLQISRGIVEQVGDTPATLRDLSVALKQIAALEGERGNTQESEQAMLEHRRIEQRLGLLRG